MGEDRRRGDDIVPDCKIEVFVMAQILQCGFALAGIPAVDPLFMRCFVGVVLVGVLRPSVRVMVGGEAMRRDSHLFPFGCPGQQDVMVFFYDIDLFLINDFFYDLRHNALPPPESVEHSFLVFA